MTPGKFLYEASDTLFRKWDFCDTSSTSPQCEEQAVDDIKHKVLETQNKKETKEDTLFQKQESYQKLLLSNRVTKEGCC